MVKTGRIKTLESGLADFLKPAMQWHGFRYNARSKTFYHDCGECVQIVSIQVGTRATDGSFTVNLGVYHPVYHEPAGTPAVETPREYDCLREARERLGSLRQSWRTRFFRRIFSDTSSWLKWRLTTESDKWWPFSANVGQVHKSLLEVVQLLERYGLPWLEHKSDAEFLKQAHERLRAANARV